MGIWCIEEEIERWETEVEKWMDKHIPDQQPTAPQPEDPISASAGAMKWGGRRGGRLSTRGNTK
jgi:hypothetical protein